MEKFLFIVAGISSLLFIVQILMMLIGANFEMDINHDVAAHDIHSHADSAVKILSVQTVLIFTMVFGWTGLSFIREQHYTTFVSLLFATGCGVIGMVGGAFILSIVQRFNSEQTPISKLPKEEVMQWRGEAYTAIQPNQAGQVSFNGRILPVRNMGLSAVRSFETVRVIGTDGDVLLVEKSNV